MYTLILLFGDGESQKFTNIIITIHNMACMWGDMHDLCKCQSISALKQQNVYLDLPRIITIKSESNDCSSRFIVLYFVCELIYMHQTFQVIK